MSRDTNRPDKLAKQMFFVGLLGLPWLWIVNILYFFDRVYGRVSCCGTGNTNATEEDRYRNGDENNTTILGLISNAEEEEEEEGNDGDGNLPSQEEINRELRKWVKRSTVGSFISSAILLSWIITFQLNKESFGPKWFVFSADSDVLTGW